MHDPQSVAHEIYLGSKQKKNGHYRDAFITIWHCDPEKDGTDDSCGWFLRARHLDPAIVEKVHKEFAFNFKHDYWFNDGGYPKFSNIGIALNMYSTAAWAIFMYQNDNKPDRKRHTKFMRKYLFEIMHFAENPTDSMADSINMKYGVEDKEGRISNFTRMVVCDIFNKLRPWYKHPRWHIHHWRITFPIFRMWYRHNLERCDRCHNRFKRQSVYTDWQGTEHWCEKCNGSAAVPTKMEGSNNVK